MKKLFLLISVALSFNILHGQSFDGIYSGIWTNPSGFIYTVNAEIQQVNGTNIEAKFIWKLNRSSDNSSIEYKMKQSILGIELLKGTFVSNKLYLKGYEKIDEFEVIGIDEYDLVINNEVVSGKTKNNGDWQGILKLSKVSALNPIIKTARMYQPKSTNSYTGQWSGLINSEGMAEGLGYFKNENFTFSGEVRNGKAEGPGYFRLYVPEQKGYYYAFGSWTNNNLTGWGHYEAPWKGIYEGELVNGLPNGRGIYYPPIDPRFAVNIEGDYHAGTWKNGGLTGKAQQKINGVLLNANCDDNGNCETEVARKDEVSLLKIALGVAVIAAIIDNKDDKLEIGNDNKSSTNIFRRIFFKGLELYFQSQKNYNYSETTNSRNLYESLQNQNEGAKKNTVPKVKKVEIEQQISSFIYGNNVDKNWVEFEGGESGYIYYSNKYTKYYIWDGLSNYWEYNNKENCISALYKYKTAREISKIGKLN